MLDNYGRHGPLILRIIFEIDECDAAKCIYQPRLSNKIVKAA